MDRDAAVTLIARMGFAARGLVYLLIGWFAIDAARGDGQPTDNQGALASLADASYGPALLCLIALGFVGYAFWRFTEAIIDPDRRSHTMKGRFERAGFALSGIAHIVLAGLTVQLVLTQSRSSDTTPGDESAVSWSAWLMGQPGGMLLLALVGVLLFVVAAVQAGKAYKGKLGELSGDVPVPHYVQIIGRIGYAARAIVFAMIGWFVIMASLHQDADRAGGLGLALRELQTQSYGAYLLGTVALGLFLFGIFSLIEARYKSLHIKAPSRSMF